MTERYKVKFLNDWKFAHGGYKVEKFKKDDLKELSEEVYKAAVEDGVVQLVDGDGKEADREKLVKKAEDAKAKADEALKLAEAEADPKKRKKLEEKAKKLVDLAEKALKEAQEADAQE